MTSTQPPTPRRPSRRIRARLAYRDKVQAETQAAYAAYRDRQRWKDLPSHGNQVD